MLEWKLDQLEGMAPESVWLEAEALTDRQAVQEFEVDKDRLNAVVLSGAERFHTSGLLKGDSYLINPSCNCSDFKAEGLCAHSIAFAVVVRSWVEQRQKPARNVRFDVDLIGSEIPFPDIWTFIRQYAKKDKDMEWQMKARFARHIPALDETKYKKLLDQVLPPTHEARVRKQHKRYQQTLRIISILRDEAIDAIALQEYKEAFLIAEAVTPKLCVLLRDIVPADPQTLELFNYFVQFVRQLHNHSIPSELRERLESWCLDLSCRSYYPNRRGHETLYADLALWLTEKEYLWESARESLDIKHHYARMNEQEIPFLAQSFSLFLAIQAVDTFSGYLQDLSRQLDKGQKLLHFAQYHLPPQQAASLLQLMTTVWGGTSLERVIQESLFQVFSAMRDEKAKKHWAKELLTRQFIPSCFDTLHGEPEADHKDFEGWLKDEVLPKLDAGKTQEYLSRYYTHTGQWELLNGLIEPGDLPLLQRLDHKLFQDAPEAGVRIYNRIIEAYLKDHHGPAAADFIGRIKSHLKEIDAYAYWKDIAQNTLTEFGDRASVVTGIYES